LQNFKEDETEVFIPIILNHTMGNLESRNIEFTITMGELEVQLVK